MSNGICCVCGHKLDSHIDEEKWWRCHSLGGDMYQCECRLIKDDYANSIDYYDVENRAKDMIKELKND